MKITYKWFIAPLATVGLGLLLRALGIDGLGDALCYVGGLAVTFLLLAWAVTGATNKRAE